MAAVDIDVLDTGLRDCFRQWPRTIVRQAVVLAGRIFLPAAGVAATNLLIPCRRNGRG